MILYKFFLFGHVSKYEVQTKKNHKIFTRRGNILGYTSLVPSTKYYVIRMLTNIIVCSHSQCPQNYDVMTLYVI